VLSVLCVQATVMSLGAVYTLQGRMTGEHLTTFLFYGTTPTPLTP
jgi:hypothetical protein